MCNFDAKGELMTHMDAIGLNVEYIDVLLRDLLESFLMPMVHGDHSPTALARLEAEPMLTKAEMIEQFMGQIGEHYRAMIPYIFSQMPMGDHATMTDDERVAEIAGDIAKAILQIAERPDWLEALKHLNAIAWAFAAGSEKRETDMGPNPVKVCKIL